MHVDQIVFTPTAAEHVLKYVKEGYSYVSEFEEDCAADDKIFTVWLYLIHSSWI